MQILLLLQEGRGLLIPRLDVSRLLDSIRSSRSNLVCLLRQLFLGQYDQTTD